MWPARAPEANGPLRGPREARHLTGARAEWGGKAGVSGTAKVAVPLAPQVLARYGKSAAAYASAIAR